MLTKEQILKRYNKITKLQTEYRKKNYKYKGFTYPLFMEKDNTEKDRQCSSFTNIIFNIATGSIFIVNRFTLNRYSTCCSRSRSKTVPRDDIFFERYGKIFDESNKKCQERRKRIDEHRAVEKKQIENELLDIYFPLKEFSEVTNNAQ